MNISKGRSAAYKHSAYGLDPSRLMHTDTLQGEKMQFVGKEYGGG